MIHLPGTTTAPLKHAWKEGLSVGAAHELLREDLRQHLRLLQREIGYRHLRFHASFHDDVGVVHREADGSLRYTWSQLDKIYDAIVEAGFDPIVELNPMPKALASGETTFFWFKMNVTPPKDYAEWGAFIQAMVAHFTERYGRRRVERWMFEVWNEPNLHGQFWTGSFEDYVRLYAASAAAVKAVCPAYRVGGPAGAGAGWNLPLLRACRDQGIPIDFVSCHGYPAGEYCTWIDRKGSPHAPGQAFVNDFREARADMDREGFAHIPIVCTEWNTLTCGATGKPEWVGSPDTTRLYSAAAACHYAVATDPFVEVLTWWAASDVFFEAGPHLQVFGQKNQYYGLLTINGTPKPACHAFRYLARLQGPCLDTQSSTPAPGQAGLRATREPDCVRLLLWNFHIPQEQGEGTWNDTITLPAALLGGATRVRAVSATIAAGAGSAYEAWQTWGRPVNLTKLEEEALVAVSQPRHRIQRVETTDGTVRVPFSLQRDEVLFVELRPDIAAASTGDLPAHLQQLNQALNYPVQA
jgi:xylan 1,4-beta-xylosidase